PRSAGCPPWRRSGTGRGTGAWRRRGACVRSCPFLSRNDGALQAKPGELPFTAIWVAIPIGSKGALPGMLQEAWTPLEWLALVERELLLFAAVFFLIGALDELAIDIAWFWLRLTGRSRTTRIDRMEHFGRPLAGRAALLIPTWREESVIGDTIAHALVAWPQADLRIYVGCYRN